MFEELVSAVLSLPPLVYVLIGLATVWYMQTRVRAPNNIPPCPVQPYPLLGHLPMLRKDPLEKLKEWHQTTGLSMYSVYIGNKLAVILNSHEVVKETIVKNAEIFSNRPYQTVSVDNKYRGILDASGELWREQRSTTLTILKDFGMGKNWLGEKITIEVEAYLDTISKLKGKPTDLNLLTYASIANVISAILIGQRFELDDPVLQHILAALYERAHFLAYNNVIGCFPWLKYLPWDVCHMKKLLKNEMEMKERFCYKYIDEMKASATTERGINFISDYLLIREKKIRESEQTLLDDANLAVVISNLFEAGTETTSTTMSWALLFATLHQDIQEKMYQEVLEVVGTDRLPSLEDKPKMNYTNAFILESLRFGVVAPLALPHVCSKTTTIAGYSIPKDAIIIINLYSMLHDAEVWGDPQVFRPERFLDKDMQLTVPEHFIPFGTGKRLCLGKSLAQSQLFLFLSGIFQRFHVKPEDPDNLPTIEPVFGITNSPKRYRIRMIERTH